MSDMVETRDRWPKGIVRHLRVDPDHPLDSVSAIRVEHNGGISHGGTVDIVYTLVVHPRHEGRVEEYRAMLEGHPGLGGPFSPPPDIS